MRAVDIIKGKCATFFFSGGAAAIAATRQRSQRLLLDRKNNDVEEMSRALEQAWESPVVYGNTVEGLVQVRECNCR